MKIALLTDGIWPFVIGGMQKHSYYLCKYLARSGIAIDLYHSTRDGRKPDLSQCFTGEELAYIKEHYISYPPSDRWPGHYLRTSYRYSKLLYAELVKNPAVDVVYAKGLTAWRLLEEKEAGKDLPPIAINVHGYEYYQKAASFRSKLEQYFLRGPFRYINEQADHIFSYGGNISAIIRKNIKNSDGRIVEVPAGIESDFLFTGEVRANSCRQFVYLGRYERRKGIEELTAAIKSLMGKYDFHFHFIGAIPESRRISSPQVTYYGRLDDKRGIESILRKCDILVCPSYAEGMPNVILEAMASGCAIIASDVGAVNVEVDSGNGWLIEPGSVKAIEDAMVKSIGMQDGLLLGMRKASMDKIKREFLWEDVIGRLVYLLNKIRKRK
ncbi:MAG: glycosyltransferase family 4 protein [Bacteroidetes bacterium]|nr:glycosyltransferase family 4 protein [Bacteroidota bacterium]